MTQLEEIKSEIEAMRLSVTEIATGIGKHRQLLYDVLSERRTNPDLLEQIKQYVDREKAALKLYLEEAQ